MGEEALLTAVMISDVSRKIMLVSEGCVRAGTQFKDTAAGRTTRKHARHFVMVKF